MKKTFLLPSSLPADDGLIDHAPALVRHARRLTSVVEAEDVAQDVLLEALVRRPRPGPRLIGWLRIATVHASRRLSTRARSRIRRERAVARIDRAPAAAQVVEQSSEERDVRHLVVGLSDPYRTVVRMRYLEGISTAEIAERTGRSPATVRSQIQRGLEILRSRLAAHREAPARRPAAFGLLALVLRLRPRFPRSRGPRAARALRAALAAVGATGALGCAVLWSARPAAERTAVAAAGVAATLPAQVAGPRSLPADPSPRERAEARLADVVVASDASSAALRVRGRVVHVNTGAGLPGVAVFAAAEAGAPAIALGATDADGRFAAELDLPAVWVWAEGPDLAPSWRRRVDRAFAAEGDGLELPMAGRRSIVGRVVDAATGRPVAGASVQSEPRVPFSRPVLGFQRLPELPPPAVEVRTDPDGGFRIAGHSSPVARLSVTADGYAPHGRSIDRERASVTVALGRGARLSGRLEPTGCPSTDAGEVRLEVERRWTFTAPVDARGRFAFEGLPTGSYELVAERGLAGAVVRSGLLAEGTDVDLGMLAASREACLVVRVSGDEEATAARVVELRPPDGEGEPVRRPAAACAAIAVASPGPFEVRLLGPGGPAAGLVVLDWHDGLRAGDLVTLEARADAGSTASVDGRLDEAALRAARLERDPALRLELVGPALVEPRPVERAGCGRFRAGPVPAGPYVLRAVSPWLGACELARFRLGAGEHRRLGTVHAPVPGALLARLDGPGEGALGQFAYELTGGGLAIRALATVSGPYVRAAPGSPTIRIEALWPGSYELAVHGTGSADETVRLDVREGACTEVALALRRATRALFRIRAERPLAPDEDLEVLAVSDRGAWPIPVESLCLDRADPRRLAFFHAGIPDDVAGIRVRSSHGLVGELDLSRHPLAQGSRYVVALVEGR